MKEKPSKMVVNNTAAFTLMFIKLVLINYVFASDLIIIPSWNDQQNGSHPCSLYKDLQNATTFAGTSFQPCDVKLISSNKTAALLRLPRETSSDTFLYVKRQGDLSSCQKRFLVITDISPCSFVLWDLENQLFLQGNTSVVISKIPINLSSSSCLKLIDDQEQVTHGVSHTRFCHTKEFNHSVSCTRFFGDSCNFNDFPYDCNATLYDIEVVFQCPKDSIHSNYAALLVYPVDVVSLGLSFKSLVRINGSPFRRLQNIKRLTLSFNKLSFVDPQTFQKLETLASLSLTGNRLVTLHVDLFTKLIMLQTLKLDFNYINDLPLGIFRNLTSLTQLHLDDNNLIFLHQHLFSDLTSLTILTIAWNKLVRVTGDLFKDLPNLIHLELTENQITSLDTNVFSRTTNIEFLTFAHNNLTVLSRGSFKGLKKLTTLHLSNNYIATLDADTFIETPLLKNIYLNLNFLTYLPSKLFNGLTNLETLTLNHNDITSLGEKLFNDTSSMTRLNLGSNRITVLPHDLFDGLTLLSYVNLQQNQMITLNNTIFKNTNDIIELTLGNNRLSNIPNGLFKGLSKLHNLRLHENQLVYLESGVFHETKSLNYLYLQENELTVLPGGLFQELIRLRVLCLNANKLKSLPPDSFAGMTSLESLFLQDNYMETVDNHILRGLHSLRHLDLSHTYINPLNIDLFQSTRNLEFLDISSNGLENIPYIYNLQRLNSLNLRNNSLIKITKETFHNISNDVFMTVSQPEICECYVSANTSCNALDDISPYLTCSRLLSDRILVVMMWLIGLNALCGNVFVLGYRKVKHDNSQIQTFLLSNLAMSDLLMGIYMLVIASADIYFGDSFPMRAESWRSGITCKIAGTISIVSSEASVFFLTLISIDRFINMKYPYSDRKLRKKSSAIIAFMLWLTSLALGVVASSFGGNSKHVTFYDNSHVCIGLPLALIKTHSKTIDTKLMFAGTFIYYWEVGKSEYLGDVPGMYFSSAIFLGLNFICFLIILLCYVEIVRAVSKSSKCVGINKDIKEEIRMTVNVSVVILTDFVCWFPIIILGILVQAKVITLPASVFAWCVTFLLPINSAINPYLYTIAHVISSYRKQVEKEKFHRSKQRNRGNSGTMDTNL